MLDPDEPAPAAVLNPAGRSPFLLIGDHAGVAIPRRLGTLGLSAADRCRHIALDIGVRDLGERLAARLDAVFLHQIYSRLVIDCNRDPASEDAMPTVSDGSVIPGNEGLPAPDRAARIFSIHRPYQERIARELEARDACGQPTVLISLHSFTPVFGGVGRPWHVGILHSDGDTRFAAALLAALGEEEGLTVGDNAPYQMDATDFTVPWHAFARRLPYAEIEVRQDLIADPVGVERWAALLDRRLTQALRLASPP